MLQLSYIVCRIQLRLLADLLLGIYTFPSKTERYDWRSNNKFFKKCYKAWLTNSKKNLGTKDSLQRFLKEVKNQGYKMALQF